MVLSNLVSRVSHLTAWGERGGKMRDPGNEVGFYQLGWFSNVYHFGPLKFAGFQNQSPPLTILAQRKLSNSGHKAVVASGVRFF